MLMIYICDVGDVCYIYLLFVWMECKKQIKKTAFSHFAECNGHDTRQSDYLRTTWEHALPSAKAIALGKHHRFAECHGPGTRQRSPLCRVSKSTALSKASTFAECLTLTLDKATVTATFLCRVSDWHSAKPLPSTQRGLCQ